MNDKLGHIPIIAARKSNYHLAAGLKAFYPFSDRCLEPSSGVEATKWMDANLQATKRHGQISEPAFGWKSASPMSQKSTHYGTFRNLFRSRISLTLPSVTQSCFTILHGSFKTHIFCWTSRATEERVARPVERESEARSSGQVSRAAACSSPCGLDHRLPPASNFRLGSVEELL